MAPRCKRLKASDKSLRMFLALLLAAGFFLACGGDPAPDPPPPAQPAPPPPPAALAIGSILPQVACADNPAYGYAIYLPPQAQSAAKMPLLLAFDSHAKGSEPVAQYKALADSLGWIVAGSNSSQNGQPGDRVMPLVNATLADILARSPADPHRIYLAGFSGGARVAAFAAQQRGDVAGVIGCGAGFQPSPQGETFSYYALVGEDDFNYLELQQLDRALAIFRGPYWIEVFDGGHAWPPLEAVLEAAEWMDFRAMAYGVAPSDSARIAAKISQLKSGKPPRSVYQQWQQERKLHAWLKDLDPLAERIEKDLEEHLKKESYQQEKQRLMTLEKEEASLREQYQFEIATKPLDYWEYTAPSLRQKGAADTERGHLYMRVVNFLSLVSYSHCAQALQLDDRLNAEKFIRIYALVDPSNSEHAYMRAQMLASDEDKGPALEALREASALGFKDKGRILADPKLYELQREPGFQEILAAISQED